MVLCSINSMMENFIEGEGSISKDDFHNLIKFIGKKYSRCKNFFQKQIENKLKNNEVCFTFDDSLKCQIEIALKF